MNMKDQFPDFTGRVLSILCASEDTGQLIADPVFEKQAGRLFLVGIVPEQSSEDDWMRGLPCAVAWDTVQDYVVFESMSDYLKRLSPKKKPKRKK